MSHSLTNKQLELIETIYKYHFISIKTASKYLGIKAESSISRRLNKLVSLGLVNKRRDSELIIEGKPGWYYLSLEGIKKVISGNDNDNANKIIYHKIVESSYRDKAVSTNFVFHSLNILNLCNSLAATYQNRLTVLTKRDLICYDFLPKIMPDLLINLSSSNNNLNAMINDHKISSSSINNIGTNNTTNRALTDIIKPTDIYYFVLVVDSYLNSKAIYSVCSSLFGFYNSFIWQDKTNNLAFPKLLIIFKIKDKTKIRKTLNMIKIAVSNSSFFSSVESTKLDKLDDRLGEEIRYILI